MKTQRDTSRRGLSSVGIAIAGTAIVVVTAIAIFRGGGPGSSDVATSDFHIVERGDFLITIPASGELAAGEQVELRCELDGTSTITEIIPEGTSVDAGAVLVKLDDQEVRDRIESSEEDVVAATNRVETRTADLAIAQKSRESNLASAKVAVDQARLVLLAWQEGDVVAQRNQMSLAVRTAEKDFKRLAEKYSKSLELRERDFISQNDLEQDEIQMIRAEAALSQAKLAHEVYEKYTYEKDKQRKETDLKQAEDELERVETRTAASVRSAESNLQAAESNLRSKKERLKKYLSQLEACTVEAPAGGMVVYGTTVGGDRWDRDETLRVGSKVSRNQLLIVLPNTDRMIADVKVNEALSGHVKAGQATTVRMDAFPENWLDGSVLAIGVLAEGGGWRDPNRRDYSVKIELTDNKGLALKPSMRCKASILVEEVKDVLYVPVQAVHRMGKRTIVYSDQNGRIQPVPVQIGRSSDLFVEISGGPEAGDRVLLTDPPPGTPQLAEHSEN